MPKKIVATLITSHVWKSHRRAGFHWIAESLIRRGWHVNFVTGYSYLDHLKGGYRKNFINFSERNKPIYQSENLTTLLNSPWVRPFRFPCNMMNTGTKDIFKSYRTASSKALRNMVSDSDLVIMESTYEIMFLSHLKKLAPKARFVYRVSDDMAVRNSHPLVIDDEIRSLHLCDIVSLPNALMCARFPESENIVEHKHGIPSYLYDLDHPSPFKKGTKNAVFTGNNFLDFDAIECLAQSNPDFFFHIIGPFERRGKSGNVIHHGEIPYDDTIPYVKHADIGLNTLTIPGFEESNKMQQYRYCNLPVLVNGIVEEQRRDRFFYKTGDMDSLLKSFREVANFVPDPSLRFEVRSWDDLVSDLLAEQGIEKVRQAT